MNTPAAHSLDALRGWARQDPRAAMKWATGLAAIEERELILETACLKIAETHPDLAVAAAEKMSFAKPTLLANLAQQWAQKDISAAYDWVISKPASDQKNELVQRIALVWAATEPKNAAQFVIEAMPPGPQQIEAAITMVHQWGVSDFNAAKAWALQFPQGEVRTRALNELSGIENYRMAVKFH